MCKTTTIAIAFFCSSLLLGCTSQHTGAKHGGHKMSGEIPLEVGQSAFAAIAEIVALLDADPNTDWDKVDIEMLRQHLIDMNLVTLQAKVRSADQPKGQLHTVRGDSEEVVAAIQRMVLAHSDMMNGSNAWQLTASKTDSGVTLEISSDDASQHAKIKGLGFAGFMALGMHHQAHHWAIARGASPH